MADEINYLYHRRKNVRYFRGYMHNLHVSSRGFISFRNSNSHDSYLYQDEIEINRLIKRG